MADLADLIQKLAYYQSGGKDKGQYTTDKLDTLSGSVNDAISNVLAVKKASLGNTKTQLETFKDFRGLTPSKDLGNRTLEEQKIQSEIDKNNRRGEGFEGDTRPAIGSGYAQRDFVKSVFPDLPEGGDVSIGELKLRSSQGRFDQTLDQRKIAQQNLDEDRRIRAEDRNTNMRTAVLTRFNSLPQSKKVQSSIDSAENVIDLISSNNPIADSAVPTYMARASGEVGNLSEADKAPFGGSQALLTRMQQAVSQATKGKLTPENREFVRQLAETMKASALRNLDRHARDFSKQNAKIGGYGNEQEIYTMINPGIAQSTTTNSPAGGFNSDSMQFSDPEKQRRYEEYKRTH